jgi:hypothetical protein
MFANGYILAAYLVSFGFLAVAIVYASWRFSAAKSALRRAQRMRG